MNFLTVSAILNNAQAGGWGWVFSGLVCAWGMDVILLKND
ncbi:hypothetical protein ALFP_0552 [Alcaligenes faecalis]|nr:hypothetical protein ALFP_0552 [Alcaligenes faecalis]